MLKQWKKTINKIQKRIMIGVLAASFFVSLQPLRVEAGEFTNNFFIKYDGQIYKYQKRLVDIQIDGELLQTGDMPAILMTGSDNSQYTMVPVREVFEAEGIDAKVEWVSSTKDVIISYQDKVVKLTIDSDLAYINNKQIKLDAPAKLIQDMSKQYPKTMLPLRFVSENLGFTVDWDPDQYVANILTTSVEEIPVEPVNPVEPETPELPEVPEQDDVTQDVNQNVDEQLDSLTSSGATRTLPTALAAKPIVFKPISTSSSSSTGTTGSSGSALSSEVSQEGLVSATNEISAKELPITSIYQVAFETTTEGVRRFVIKANEGISKVESSYWNGKLVLKVFNASLDVDSTVIDYTNNDIVSKIEMGDHSTEDPSYSQINLVLKASSFKFNIKISEDRKYVYIEAVDASVSQIELAQDDIGDYIDITGTTSTNVQVFRLSNPTRLVFDIPNTKTLLASQSSTAEGQYVNSIRTAQFTPTTTRVVVETQGQADYVIKSVEDQKVRIQLVAPGFENISYDHTTEIPTIIIDKEIAADQLDISKIQYVDDYLQREYTIIIPGDHLSSFGNGYVNVNDSIIDHIKVSLDSNKNTLVKIKAKTIHEFRIVEENGNIAIKVYRPTELYKKVIVVDAGHGGKDPGAVIGAFKEKDTNLGVTLELKKLLDQQKEIKVYYTRTTDTYPTLEQRSVLANEVDADFFISLHCNSFTSNFFGTETLYLPGPNTPGLNSFELAQIIQDVFTENTQLTNYKIKDRTGLYVLNKTDMPAVILEMGYLSNENDRKYLTDTNYYDDMGRAVYLAILEVFELYPTGR